MRPCALRVPPCPRCVRAGVCVLVYMHRYTNLFCILPDSGFRLKVHPSVLGVGGGESRGHPKPRLNLTWAVGLGEPSSHLDFEDREERGRGGQSCGRASEPRGATVPLWALQAGLWELQEDPAFPQPGGWVGSPVQAASWLGLWSWLPAGRSFPVCNPQGVGLNSFRDPAGREPCHEEGGGGLERCLWRE